ncbi:hypothetical protein ACFQ9X_06420 [Catenulispora yoronensis]
MSRLKRFLAASALASTVAATPVAVPTLVQADSATAGPGITHPGTVRPGQPSCVGCWAIMTEV